MFGNTASKLPSAKASVYKPNKMQMSKFLDILKRALMRRPLLRAFLTYINIVSSFYSTTAIIGIINR